MPQKNETVNSCLSLGNILSTQETTRSNFMQILRNLWS